MAATGTKKTANTTKKAAAAAADAPAEPMEVSAAEQKKIVPKEVDLSQYIPVKNGFHGTLVYRSSKTGEVFRWDSFGEEQYIELMELRNAKNSAKGFFINNWFLFDDEYAWVIDYLGLGQYYRYAVGVNGMEELFSMTPDGIRKTLGKLSDGQKRSIAYMAISKIGSGEIDSLKTIAALEDALGIDLIEK
jgi:hypothetical protein